MSPSSNSANSSIPIHSVAQAQPNLERTISEDDMSASSGSQSPSNDGTDQTGNPTVDHLARPRLGSRKSSGTIIIPRDTPVVELQEEEYDDGDARTMSPRRSSEEIEKMGTDARKALIEQAKQLQQSLLEICDRVESVRHEHEKLEGGNRFLQSYIGELMQTSKITATSSKGKGKARA